MASINVTSNVNQTSVGQFIQADVVLDAQGKNLNAVSGDLNIPVNFQLIDVLDGGTVVGLWIERPTVGSNDVQFSGVIPGGYSGKHGKLFSVRLRATNAGDAQLAIADGTALLNDGKGTAAPFSTTPLSVSVAKSGLLSVVPVTVNDTESPEAFTPVLAHQATVFDGKWFLVFSTQDKLSGVDHYEVQEGTHPFVRATSPYQLQDQTLESQISVRAVDRFGNTRVEVVPATNPIRWYEHGSLWGILLVTLLGGVAVWRRFHRKKAV